MKKLTDLARGLFKPATAVPAAPHPASPLSLADVTYGAVIGHLADAPTPRVETLYRLAQDELRGREARYAPTPADLDDLTQEDVQEYLGDTLDSRVFFLARAANEELAHRGYAVATQFEAEIVAGPVDLSTVSYWAVAEHLKTADEDVLAVLDELLTEERARRAAVEPTDAHEDTPADTAPTTD